jgi:heme-degrading monooxygenase HmoA
MRLNPGTPHETSPGRCSAAVAWRQQPTRFLSFGVWSDAKAVAVWRSSRGFRERLGRCRALCEQFEGHDFEVAAAPHRR